MDGKFLFMLALYFSSQFSIITVMGQLVTRHPDYIDCALPGSDDIIVVQENGTVQRCENGRLEIKYCFAGITSEGEYECVEHYTIRKTMDELPPWQKYFMDRLYVKNSGKRLVECRKVWLEHPKQLNMSPNKINCLTGLGVTPVQSVPMKNRLCSADRHKVVYIERRNVKVCKSDDLETTKCMVMVGSRWQCIRKDLFPRIPDIDVNSESFCYQFSKRPSLYLPDYETLAEDCSHGIHEPEAPEPEMSQVDTPQFIDCSRSEISGYFREQLMVQGERSWYECSDGRLQLTKCITSKNVQRRCIRQETIKDHFKRGGPGIDEKKYYINRNLKNDVNCSSAVAYFQSRNFDVVHEACSSPERPTEPSHFYSDLIGQLCTSFNTKGYLIVKHGFFECDGRHLKLTKCMVHIGNEYLCVVKRDVEAILQFTPSSSEDEICDEFAFKYETLKMENYINTIACNTPMDVPSPQPFTSTRAPSTRVITLSSQSSTTTPFRRYTRPLPRPTRRRYTASKTTTKTTRTPVTIRRATTLNPRMCTLSPNGSPNSRRTNYQLPGKCINIDDFIEKFDNMNLAQLGSKIDLGKVAQTGLDLLHNAGKMTLGELGQIGSTAVRALMTPGTDAAIKLVQMFKTGYNDCDVLREHVIVYTRELCDLIKDCDPTKPARRPPFC